jgi:hypothetical protein
MRVQSALGGISASESASAPLNVRIALQGVTFGNQASNAVPPAPNDQTTAWQGVAGADHYGLYFQTYDDLGNIVTAYPALGSPNVTVTATAAASAWSSYVSGQGAGIGIVPGCDHAYQDTAATNIATYTFLTPSAFADNPDGQVNGPNTDGVYFPNQGRTVRVTAIASGVESAMSDDSEIVLLANGQMIMIAGNFSPGGSTTWADATCPAPSPLGYTTNTKFAYNTSTYNYCDFFTGYGCTNTNLGVSGYVYLNWAIYPGQSGSDLGIQSEIWKDYVVEKSVDSLSNWGPASPPTGQWTVYKLPLSTIHKNVAGGTSGGSSGNNIVQLTDYKDVLVNNKSSNTDYFWFELWLSRT